jgi:hypothetical protein
LFLYLKYHQSLHRRLSATSKSPEEAAFQGIKTLLSGLQMGVRKEMKQAAMRMGGGICPLEGAFSLGGEQQ